MHPVQIANVIFNADAALRAARGEAPIAVVFALAPEAYRQGLTDAIQKRIADPEFAIPVDGAVPALSLVSVIFGSVVDSLKGMTTEPAKLVKPEEIDLASDDAPALVPVKYIGHRATYKDGACGSNLTFAQCETRLVPIRAARIMLREHTDVWVPGDVAADPVALVAPPKVENKAEETEEARLQETRDAIAAMREKAAVVRFIEIELGHKVDGRKSLADLKTHATMLVDQYGVPA